MRLTNIGDIYAYEVERIGGWSAIQVTGLRTEGNNSLVGVLQLDYFELLPPSIAELSALRALYVDFMFWRGQLDHQWCDSVIPKHFMLIGHATPNTSTDDLRTYGGWPGGGTMVKQRAWDEIDPSVRDQFKAAIAFENKKTLWTDGNRTITESTTRVDSDDFDDGGPPIEIIHQLHALTKLVITRPFDQLVELLARHRFLYEAELSGLGLATLDLSGSHLNSLIINVTGLQLLRLPDRLNKLSLTGSIASLHIEVTESGRWLELNIQGIDAIAGITGLEQLRSLAIHKLSDASASSISTKFRALESLIVRGEPGHFRDIGTLSTLSHLRDLALYDLFSMSPDEFPPPSSFPQLSSLTMLSIPADVANHVKTVYRPFIVDGLELDIRQPRKAEWLAENLDNPFRAWDGQVSITPTQAKKAATAFKSLRQELLKLDLENAEPPNYLLAVGRYAEVFRLADKKKPFIYTEERDQIYGAVQQIITTINISRTERGVSPIDYEPLWREIDRVGDF